MKKMFTKLFSTGLLICLTLIGVAVKAQTTSLSADATTAAPATGTTATDMKAEVKAEAKAKTETPAETKAAAKPADADTTWKPQRRLWGYTFGDFYYDAHSDAGNRGPETMYNGVASSRNAFQFRRLYLGYDYEITKKFKAEVLLASEPNANTGVSGTTSIQNGDNLVDGKMAFWIKNFNLRVRDLWTGTDFVIGEMSTPGFALNEPGTNGPTSLSEATWAFRSIEKTITDFHKNNSYDVGAALQGTFDPSTKNFGYVLMVGNNSTSSLLPAGATNANTGFYKIFYGDIWGKFLNQKLYVDLYADYAKTAAATATIPGQEHNMLKIFAAYNTKPITVGVEAYTQQIASGVTNTATKTPENATVHGFSIWARGAIVKNLNYFARYDSYNPDTQFNSADSYTINTNYGSYNPTVKETFYTAGIDYNPTKNVHFMPNFWLIDYKDQRASTTTGYVGPDHTLVFRFTFFYTFGK
ncbi:MAG: hypothetical protein JWQ84_1557 [Mucilaginibacter sp.]|nr:hypothetical protein [Mucilaginibacter sp.]